MTGNHNYEADDIYKALCVMYGDPIKPLNIPKIKQRLWINFGDPINKPAKR